MLAYYLRMPDSAQGPVIDGWSVAQGDDGETWTARRRGGLSTRQLEYGCRLVVGANSLGELEVACVTEDVRAGLVAAAERLAARMSERMYGAGQ